MASVQIQSSELIGKTPFVKLNHIVDEDNADVYLKLEFIIQEAVLKIGSL